MILNDNLVYWSHKKLRLIIDGNLKYEQFTVKPIQASFSTVIIKVDKLRNKIYVYRKTIHSSTLAWKIPLTEECCRLRFMG